MPEMIRPELLKPGDTIAFYSPSSPATAFAPKRYERAKAYLEGKGFQLLAGNLTGKIAAYRSGTIVDRAKELNDLIHNPDVRCIMSTIGGMNSNSLLPYIDYDALIDDPKILIGYSDVTAILLGVYAKTGLITFYGPALVASFGEFEPLVDITYRSFEQILVHPAPLPFTYHVPESWMDEVINWEEQSRSKKLRENQWISVFPGKACGTVIGGNLNTLQGFWGSQYIPPINDGDILFIEDSLKDAATLERSFSFLKVNGVFDRISGIIFGKHEQFNDRETGLKPYEILEEVLHGQELPFLADFDCSHTHPMLTLPIGIKVELDATNKTVSILSSWWEEDQLCSRFGNVRTG